jgi:hypothetical protein
MLDTNRTTFKLALIATVATVEAAIVTDGLWTGHDWEQTSTGYKFVNGVPTSDDLLTARRL